MGIIYFLGKTSISVYYRLFYKININGEENIPKKGAVLLCSNHTSHHDPMALACFVKRPVCFLGKKELFKKPFFAFVLKRLGVIPVDRSANDMSAYKKTLERLSEGRVVGIFAQGTRVKDNDAASAKSGIALFAAKSGAVVVPVKMTSTYKKFGTINIHIGKPVDISDMTQSGKALRSPQLASITERIMQAVSNLPE